MAVESVHVYTLIATALSSIFAVFFLSSLLSSKFLKVAIGLGGITVYATACTASLLALVGVLNSLYLPPMGVSTGILLGLFAIQFVLTKKLTPRLAKAAGEPSAHAALPSALRLSLINSALNVVLLTVASFTVASYFFGA